MEKKGRGKRGERKSGEQKGQGDEKRTKQSLIENQKENKKSASEGEKFSLLLCPNTFFLLSAKRQTKLIRQFPAFQR